MYASLQAPPSLGSGADAAHPHAERLSITPLRWEPDDLGAVLGEEDNGGEGLEAQLLGGELTVNICLVLGDSQEGTAGDSQLLCKLGELGLHGLRVKWDRVLVVGKAKDTSHV